MAVSEPRKPPIENLPDFEDKGVEYIIKDPEFYRDKKVVISGEGQRLGRTISATASPAKYLRTAGRLRRYFDSVQPRTSPKRAKSSYQRRSGGGRRSPAEADCQPQAAGQMTLETDHWVPLFGLSLLGPTDWNLNIVAVEVDTFDYSTNAGHDRGHQYPGKLKLILCGFTKPR